MNVPSRPAGLVSVPRLVLWLSVAVLLPHGTAAAGEEVMVDGVLHVRNPAEPPEGVETLELEELWRVGDEDDDLLLGLPTGLDWDAAGRVYVLDAQLNRVHVFSPDGELLDTRSREGDGPGEMRNPSDLIVWPDGGIGVLQEYPGKVIRLDAAGDPLPSLHPGGATEEGGFGVLGLGRFRGGNLVISGMMTRLDEEGRSARRSYLAAFDDDGVERFAYMENVRLRDDEPRSEEDMLQHFAFAWALGPDGRVFVPMSWTDYVLRVVAADGTVDRVIERAFDPLRRSEADRRFMLRLMGVPEGAPPPMELAEHEPTISVLQGGVQVAENGEAWVLTSRGVRDLPEGVLARFDVFDREGHFRRQVDVRCQGDPRNDRLVVLPDGRMIRQRRFVDALVTSLGPGALPEAERDDEDASPAVICYRMVR